MTLLSPSRDWPHSLSDAGKPLAQGVALLVLAIGAGVAAVLTPLLGVLAMLAVVVLVRSGKIWQDALLLMVVGNMTLGYGFANVGIRLGPVPLPLTDVLLLALLGYAMVGPASSRALGLPGRFLIAILIVTTLRVLADFPEYGVLAVRDATTSLEATAVVVGFWAFRTFGFEWARRVWWLAALATLAYCLLFSFEGSLVALSPVVGLQQAVPLLGNFSGAMVGIGAALLFFLVMGRAPWSYLLGALALGAAILFQSRGLYLVIPLSAVLIMCFGARFGQRLPLRIIGCLVIAVFLLVLLAPLQPQGRLGPVTADFTNEQLGTLLGREGAGAGSYEDRLEWLNVVREKQLSSATNLIVGVGLGPDLAQGFSNSEQFVRKPHNDYVEIFARFGLVGLVCWGGLFVSILLPMWHAVRREGMEPGRRSFLLWTIGASFVYLFIAATQPLLAFPYGTLPLFLILGMALALAKEPRDDALEPVEATHSQSPAARL